MSKWTNGSFDIAWLNEDKVIIRDRRFEDQGLGHRVCVMDGGDFEHVLQGLIAAYTAGEREER